MIDVKIPALGESITSGILAKWHVKDGDTVTRGQPIFELETDKITSEAQAESAGRIALKAASGAEVSIGQVVATIDETVAVTASAPAATTAPAAVSVQHETSNSKLETLSPAARRVAAETNVDPATVSGTGKGGRVTKGDLLSSSAAAIPVPGAPSLASRPRRWSWRHRRLLLRKPVNARRVHACRPCASALPSAWSPPNATPPS